MSKYQEGFTLVELMIALALSGIIVAAVYSAYILQQKTKNTQGQVIEIQQNLRAALVLMADEFRMAGFDPTGEAGAGITTATETAFAFTLDEDGDGKLDYTDPLVVEAVGYELSGNMLQRTSNGAAPHTILEDCDVLEFFYTLQDGSELSAPSAGELDKIVAVRISILAKSRHSDTKYVNDQVYVTGSNTTLATYNDNYRRRLLVSTINLRNRGF